MGACGVSAGGACVGCGSVHVGGCIYGFEYLLSNMWLKAFLIA